MGVAVFAACGGAADPDVPPVVTITGGPTAALSSGASVQLSATLTDRRGKAVVAPAFTWGSSNPQVVSVSPSGLITGATAGTATISATSTGAEAGAVGSVGVTVVPGAPFKLVIATQPAGAASGVRLVTQPVVQVRDISDNVVTASTLTINATLVGAGTLAGATAAAAVQGVARFTDLGVTGQAGGRTIQFFAQGVTSATSDVFTLAPGPAAVVAYTGTTPLVLRSGIATTLTVQLRDREGNSATAAGRRVVATVTGGTGTTQVTNATTTTDANGRATFAGFAVAGVAGARTLSFAADSITTPGTVTASLTGGRPTRLALDRDLPAQVEIGVPVSPAPIVRMLDSVGNAAPELGVTVTASVSGTTATTVLNGTARTDSLGRATFPSLTLQGASGTRSLQFDATGFTGVASRSLTVAPPDTTTPPTFITTALSAADTTQRTVLLASTTASLTPFLSARNAQQAPISTAGVRWSVRDASRATVAPDGRITGLREGRTFVVAEASRNTAVADSLLVFIPKTGTGPIVRTTLPTYRITTDTFSIVVQIESRDGQPLSAADLEIAWPGVAAFPYSPFTVTSFTRLRSGVEAQQVDAQETVRVTWTSATPVSGPIELIRLSCRVYTRRAGNQLVIRLNQLLRGDLTDVTAGTSVYNPIVIIP